MPLVRHHMPEDLQICRLNMHSLESRHHLPLRELASSPYLWTGGSSNNPNGDSKGDPKGNPKGDPKGNLKGNPKG